MPESKEQAILEAAIHEFSEKGFDKASTNQIAKLAQVSKGLLFHYFESKEKLYEACVLHAIDFTLKELDFENWPVTNNMIADLRFYCETELRFLKKYPGIYRLLAEAISHPPKALSEQMAELYVRLKGMSTGFFAKMVGGLNLKEDVDAGVLQAVIQSHWNYYESRAMGYLKQHPDAEMESFMPLFEQFLAMISMSLRGLLKEDDGKG